MTNIILRDPVEERFLIFQSSNEEELRERVLAYLKDQHQIDGGSVQIHLREFSDLSEIQLIFNCCGGKRGFETLLRKEAMKRKKLSSHLNGKDLNGKKIADVEREERMRDWLLEKESRAQVERVKKIEKLEKKREAKEALFLNELQKTKLHQKQWISDLENDYPTELEESEGSLTWSEMLNKLNLQVQENRQKQTLEFDLAEVRDIRDLQFFNQETLQKKLKELGMNYEGEYH